MLKYYYYLYFEYNVEPYGGYFQLGYFSTPKKAREAIEYYVLQKGFSDYGLKYFHINKTGVKISGMSAKHLKELYVLSYEYNITNDETAFVIYAPCETIEECYKIEGDIKKTRIYKKYLFDICISKWAIDEITEWLDGFEHY